MICKYRHPAVLLALLLGWGQIGSAQTADEIAERHLAAIGGREALSKLTSRSTTGSLSVTTPAGELSGTVEVLNQKPNKVRTLIKLDLSALGAGEMVIDQRFDGQTGYVLDTLRGNSDMTASQLETLKNASFPTPFLNYMEMGATLDLAGKEKVRERDSYLLILKPKSGSPVRAYIDAVTYLPTRTIAKIDAPQVGEIEQTTDFLEHQDVYGVKVPSEITLTSSVQNVTIKVTKMEHNVKIDDALFSKPAAEK